MVAALLLHCTGLGNMLPWGGPTARAAVSMKAEMGDVFGPLIIPLLACVAWTFVVACIFGRMERKRIGVLAVASEEVGRDAAAAARRGVRLAFNWALTIGAHLVPRGRGAADAARLS